MAESIALQAFGGTLMPQGTTNIGKELAAASLAGLDNLKTVTPDGQRGVINATAFLRTPKGSNLAGNLDLANVMDVPTKLKIIVDTRANTDATRNFVLFDTLGIHTNECAIGNCPGGGGGSSLDQTKVYLDRLGNECGYDILKNEICSRSYVFTGCRFKPKAYAPAGGSVIVPLQTDVSVRFSHKTIQGKTVGEDDFSTDDHEASNQTRDIFNIPLTGYTQILTKYTAITLEYLEPGHIFSFELTTAAAGLIF